ncbi:MAG: hypothetical protein NVSMB17_18590 [Candidatus Dormibacteria bacterium]
MRGLIALSTSASFICSCPTMAVKGYPWRIHILSSDVMDTPSRTVDARGLRCPLPLVRAREEMEWVKPGEVLEVLATDPGADHDLRSWCRRKSYEMEEATRSDDVLRFLIRCPPAG